MRCLIALLALAALPAVASSSAWTSYLKIEHFTDLVALPDQVWGATAEAGLLRWNPLPHIQNLGVSCYDREYAAGRGRHTSPSGPGS